MPFLACVTLVPVPGTRFSSDMAGWIADHAGYWWEHARAFGHPCDPPQPVTKFGSVYTALMRLGEHGWHPGLPMNSNETAPFTRHPWPLSRLANDSVCAFSRGRRHPSRERPPTEILDGLILRDRAESCEVLQRKDIRRSPCNSTRPPRRRCSTH